MQNRTFVILLIITTILFNIGCDQSTKSYAYNNLRGQNVINVIGDFFILVYAENDGAFLGMGSDLPQPLKMLVFKIFPVAALIFLSIFIILNKKFSKFQIVCLSCIIGGGASNVFDRIFNDGLVIDFLNFGINNLRTGILNFADLSITFGAVFLLLNQYVVGKSSKKCQADDGVVKF